MGRGVGDVWVAFHVVGYAKSRENSDFMMGINEINVDLSENFQRYIAECCESEYDGKIYGFGVGCCKRRGRGRHYCVSPAIVLSFDGQTDQQCPVTTGIPQGSPASPVLFLLYL
jgi:hypothetical protein